MGAWSICCWQNTNKNLHSSKKTVPKRNRFSLFIQYFFQCSQQTVNIVIGSIVAHQTDADDLSLVRNGVPTVLLSLPLKYMHTNVETFDMHALEEGGRLLAHYLSAMDASWEEELWN